MWVAEALDFTDRNVGIAELELERIGRSWK
jgi:hypothetical protein